MFEEMGNLVTLSKHLKAGHNSMDGAAVLGTPTIKSLYNDNTNEWSVRRWWTVELFEFHCRSVKYNKGANPPVIAGKVPLPTKLLLKEYKKKNVEAALVH